MEVKALPPRISYFPNFITAEEEEFLMRKVYDAPKIKWTQLSNRRLQNWGGLPHAKGMIQEPLPTWLQSFMDRITESTGAFTATTQPNHCLVNEYMPGQGIMPHEDGNMFYPTVSTITLGSHTVLDFYKHINDEDCETLSIEDRYIGSVLLERCSLVLVQDSMYKTHLHGIKEVTYDTLSQSIANIDQTEHSLGDQLPRDTRVSLTIRHVNKTTNISKSISLFGKHKK